MFADSNLTSAQILTAFGEEIAARGGSITETFQDHQRLFTRSILPHVEDVRPRDRVQGGVALKATAEEVSLYPYVFRLVCRNGAIIAQTLESRSLGNLNQEEPETAIQSLRESIDACCEQEVFQKTVRKMRTACDAQVDIALNLMPLLSRLSTGTGAALLSQILQRFFGERDQSQFGLANAITSVARDTRDPDLKWTLEEFGGAVAMGATPLRLRRASLLLKLV